MQLALCLIISSSCSLYILTLEVFSYCVVVLCCLVGGLKSARVRVEPQQTLPPFCLIGSLCVQRGVIDCVPTCREKIRGFRDFPSLLLNQRRFLCLTRLLKAASHVLKNKLYSIRNILIAYI